eukprot:s561_g5.t1
MGRLATDAHEDAHLRVASTPQHGECGTRGVRRDPCRQKRKKKSRSSCFTSPSGNFFWALPSLDSAACACRLQPCCGCTGKHNDCSHPFAQVHTRAVGSALHVC